MRLPRILLLWIVLLSSFALHAQTERDFILPAVDPRTFEAGDNCDLYLIRSDGSRVVNLTDTALDSENRAVWSSDGRRLYFSRNSVGQYQGFSDEQSSTSFYVMDVSEEGENLGERLLFQMSDVFGRPLRVEEWVLSPDEQTIAFQPYDYIPPDGALFDEDAITLYSVAVDGTNLRRLIVGPWMQVHGETLQWSPDGAEIAFSSRICEAGLCGDEHFVIRPRSLSLPEPIGDVGNLLVRWHPEMEALLADEAVRQYDAPSLLPVLSPDKSAVLYSHYDVKEQTSTLMLILVDEPSEPHSLTTAFDDGIWFPRWSPDGAQIAFLLRDGGSFNISVYRVNADGSDLTELYRARMWDFTPVEWRPDVQ
jgi:Tol biopolymer transport system component